MRTHLLLAAALLTVMAGCSTLTLAPADFSWPVMSELTADKAGMAREDRYHIAFNVKPLLYDELKDSSDAAGKTFSVIRDRAGFYYITAAKFKNVYVFKHGDEGLALDRRIPVHQTGFTNPEFNQRPPYIQLLNGRDKAVLLTRGGIATPPAPEKGEGK